MDGDPVGLDDGVWPEQLQRPEFYSRRGLGSYGSDDEVEYRGSDYRNRDFYYPWDDTAEGKAHDSEVLTAMVKIWSYWIALTDCDGFRIDTYKHVPEWVSLEFTRRIREFAEDLGKQDFLIMGEIGGSEAVAATYLSQPNLRLLGLDGRRQALRELAGGRAGNAERVLRPTLGVLNGFDHLSDEAKAKVEAVGDVGIRDRFVMSIDDHDGLGIDELRRIAGRYGTHAVLPAAAFLLFGPGIPCLYYGTEQALTGPPLKEANGEPAAKIIGNLTDYGWNNRGQGGDRYLREAMFGPQFPLAAGPPGRNGHIDTSLPGFGPLGTSGLSAFDPDSPWYKGISALATLRREMPVLATGEIDLLTTGRLDGGRFGVGLPVNLIAWTRSSDGRFALIVVNLTTTSDAAAAHRVEVSVPFDQPVIRRVRIVGEGEPDITPVDTPRTRRPDTGLCYLDLDVVRPGEVRVYVSEPTSNPDPRVGLDEADALSEIAGSGDSL
jgi:hypothetical protein